MHTFAVVVGKQGRAIPATVVEILDEANPAELAFEPDGHLLWRSEDGRTAFGGWQCATENLGIGSHWEVRPTGLTAFSGHIWRRGASWAWGRSWAAQLADRWDRVPMDPSLDDFEGMYTVVSLASDGRGCLASDPLGLGMLYRAESADVVVVATRASLAARLVSQPGREPARDVEGAGWMVYGGTMGGDRTGFEDVRVLPQASAVHLQPGKSPRIRVWSAAPWLPESPIDDLASAVEAVVGELTASIRSLAGLHAPTRMAELTGGKDSRLVLALLLSEGLADQFVFNTWGSPELPDCIVATAIADRFGLEHRASTRALPAAVQAQLRPAPEIGFAERLRHHVAITEGMLSAWELRSMPQQHSPNLSLTGLGGNDLRLDNSWAAGLRSLEDLSPDALARGFGFVGGAFLEPDVRAHYADQVVAQIASLQRVGGELVDAIDGFHLAARFRRRFGGPQEIDRRNRVSPLYSLRALRLAFAIGASRRRAEVVPFELMRATHEELARLPFAGPGWPQAAYDHLPDRFRFQHEPEPAQAAKPAPTPVAATFLQEVRSKQLAERLPVLRAQLDLGNDHPLSDLVDLRALRKAIEDFPRIGAKAQRGVYAAATAAMWLSRSEQTERHEIETPGLA